jgi:hypothetical protein
MKSSCCLVLAVVSLGCNADPGISNVDDGKGAGGGAGTGGPTRGGGNPGGGANGGTGDFKPPVWSDGGAPPSTMGPGSNPDQKNCGLQTFKLQRRPAELMLVLDRSGSMNMPAGPTSITTKWTDVTDALNETIMKTESAVQWGLKAFPTGTVMCGVNDGVEVPSAPMNYATVWAQIQANAPGGGAGGGTPTTVAIDKAVAYLKATPSQNPRYLVLATDGEPNCAMGGNTGGGRRGGGGTGAADDAAAIMSVASAATAGFKTFVIGVATGADAENVLTGMAMAGGEPRVGATPPYYPVASKQDLINALGTITGLITDCVFRLSQPPPSPPDVAVNVGSARVSRDTNHMNGWDYNAGNDSIQFYGQACEDVKKASGQNVQIIYGCPGVVIR